MLGHISSELDDLDFLHNQYKWIPNRNQIRPSKNALYDKNRTLDWIKYEWQSMGDFIRANVFNLPWNIHERGKKIVREHPTWIVFQPSRWPYQLDVGEHYILWYPTKERLVSNYQIDLDIQNSIHKLHFGPYDYAWYINPKISINDYFHVQVFLIRY